jgi:Branched-chain amino acid transport system / permease component
MLTTIAVGTMIESSTTALFGSNPRGLPTPLMERPIRLAGAGIYPQELLLPVALLVVAAGLEFFYRRTVIGRAMRAVAYNRVAAGLVGINADRISLLAFALAGSLGGLSGVLIGPVIQVSSAMGAIIGLKGFLVAIIAGIANARGVVIAGLLYGVAEKLIEAYLSTAAVGERIGAGQAESERPRLLALPAADRQLGLGVDRPPSLARQAIKIGMMLAPVQQATHRRMLHGAARHVSSQNGVRSNPGIGPALCAGGQLARTVPAAQPSGTLFALGTMANRGTGARRRRKPVGQGNER